MIRNNLAILMAEKQRRVNELANETGISRITITSTRQNSGKMIQLATVNKLCQSLKVEPQEFFEFVPFDFEYSMELEKIANDINHAKNFQTFDTTLFINITENNKFIEAVEFYGVTNDLGVIENERSFNLILNPLNNSEHEKIEKYISQLSTAFITDIQRDIESLTTSAIVRKMDIPTNTIFDYDIRTNF